MANGYKLGDITGFGICMFLLGVEIGFAIAILTIYL